MLFRFTKSHCIVSSLYSNVFFSNNISFIRFCTVAENQINRDKNLNNRINDALSTNSDKSEWNAVIKNAEKIVGYSTSFLNLRWLLSDEVANVAQHLRKLVGIDHPILKTAKDIICNEQNNAQSWGLIILLLSKAVGCSDKEQILTNDEIVAIQSNQRILAELTEIIRTGNLIHKGIVNIFPNDKPKDGIIFGNKFSLLIGDYLLVTANGMLANLKNQHISALISSALRDLSEGEFVGERDLQNFPLPTKPTLLRNDKSNLDDIELYTYPEDGPINPNKYLGYADCEWTVRSVLSGGSLLGRACEGAIALGNHPKLIQKQGYYLGCYLHLAFCANDELATFKTFQHQKFSLVSAPVLFTLKNNIPLYEHITSQARKGEQYIDYAFLYDAVKSGPGLDHTAALCSNFSRKSLSIVSDILPNNDTSLALRKLIFAATSSQP